MERRYLRHFGALAQAVDYLSVTVSRVSTSTRLSYACNLLQYPNVRLKETTRLRRSHVRDSDVTEQFQRHITFFRMRVLT